MVTSCYFLYPFFAGLPFSRSHITTAILLIYWVSKPVFTSQAAHFMYFLLIIVRPCVLQICCINFYTYMIPCCMGKFPSYSQYLSVTKAYAIQCGKDRRALEVGQLIRRGRELKLFCGLWVEYLSSHVHKAVRNILFHSSGWLDLH